MSNTKILFVEDEPAFDSIVHRSFRKEIQSGEYEIIVAHSGEEALEKVAENPAQQIDLILTDLRMPKALIDGWQLIKILNEKKIYIKTIVISAYGNIENFTKAIRENILFFINKPAQLRDIKPLIKAALDKEEPLNLEINKLGFKPIFKAARNLPSKFKAKLISNLLEYLELEELEQLQAEIPQKLSEYLETAGEREKLKKLLIEKQKKGELKLKVDLESIEYFFIQPKIINGYGPYYYVRFWQDGKLKSIYLGKENPYSGIQVN